MNDPVELEFSRKYNEEHARQYEEKHHAGFWRQMSHRRDEYLARRALAIAGEPGLVLDLPCGAGRFWPVLAEKRSRVIIGADNSPAMIDVALQTQRPEIVERVRPLHTSAFDISLPDCAVDSIFCMRLLHHVGSADHRLAMLREFYRVTRDSVIVSLWVDGNFKAWRRKRLEAQRSHDGAAYQNRFVVPANTVESEFRMAGFRIQRYFDFLPMYAMWRVYVLKKDA